MIVSPNFLRHVLPHFYADDVAMVQTPQSFYNIPDDDPFAHENTVLYEIVLKAKDYKGCVPCVGMWGRGGGGCPPPTTPPVCHRPLPAP